MSVEIIKNAIPRSLCLAAEAAWPTSDWQYWHRYRGQTGDKFGSMDRSRIPVACLVALDALAIASIPFIGESFIDYDLHAAGCHMLGPGGFLGRHVDAVCHPIRSWRRTHSIVLNVNSLWKPEMGGELILENEDGNQVVHPEIGKAVIFETANQWHEVKQVSQGFGVYRKTLALFAWKQEWNCDGPTSANFEKG